MSKKIKQITETQFRMGIAIIIILFVVLFYYAVLHDRLQVRESDRFLENRIISPDHPLSYETEFCASKLTNLAHEIHFIGQEVEQQKNLVEIDDPIEEGEKKIIKIEQREITEVKAEFERYKDMCDQFDINPTKELCNQFLDEANNKLELVRENAEALKSKGILDQIQIQLYDLRKADRIYENLQVKCEGIE